MLDADIRIYSSTSLIWEIRNVDFDWQPEDLRNSNGSSQMSIASSNRKIEIISSDRYDTASNYVLLP